MYMDVQEIRCSMAHVDSVDDVICFILSVAHIVNASWFVGKYQLRMLHDVMILNACERHESCIFIAMDS